MSQDNQFTIRAIEINNSLPESWNDFIQNCQPQFQTEQIWINSWLAFLKQEWEPLILEVKCRDEVAGYFPLMFLKQKRKGFIPFIRVRFLAYNKQDFCFVPAKSQYLEDVVREAINWLKTKRKWNLLILDDLHEKYPGNAIIREEIKSHFNSMIHQKGKYYFIDLHREWSDIERQISRKSVRRKCNALENKARNLEVLFNPDWPATKMAELISTMHTCRQEMLGRRPSYASEKQKLFLHTILAHNMTNKKLFTSWLLIDNEIAAYKIGFVENATYYAWNTAIDSRFLDLSVGKYLTFRLLKHLHREGVYEYNFMRGEGGEKDKWTPTTRVNNRYIVNNSYWWYARLIQIFDRSGHVQ